MVVVYICGGGECIPVYSNCSTKVKITNIEQ